MSEVPYIPLYVEPLLADTFHLSDAEFGLYMRVLCRMWLAPDARLPNDWKWLERKLATTREELEPIIREFCKTDGNWITQKRLAAEYQRSNRKSNARSDAAKARWAKEKEACKSNARARVPQPQPQLDSPIGESPPLIPPKPARKKAARLSPDWALDDKRRAYATGRGYSEIEANELAEDFQHHFTSGNGHTKAHLDWDRTWQVWVRNSPGMGKPPGFLAGNRSRGNGHDAAGAGRPDGGLAGAAARLLDRAYLVEQ